MKKHKFNTKPKRKRMVLNLESLVMKNTKPILNQNANAWYWNWNLLSSKTISQYQQSKLQTHDIESGISCHQKQSVNTNNPKLKRIVLNLESCHEKRKFNTTPKRKRMVLNLESFVMKNTKSILNQRNVVKTFDELSQMEIAQKRRTSCIRLY